MGTHTTNSELHITILQCLVCPPKSLPRRKSPFLPSVITPKAPIIAVFTGTLEERNSKEKAFIAVMDAKFKSRGVFAEWFSCSYGLDPAIAWDRYLDRLADRWIDLSLIENR